MKSGDKIYNHPSRGIIENQLLAGKNDYEVLQHLGPPYNKGLNVEAIKDYRTRYMGINDATMKEATHNKKILDEFRFSDRLIRYADKILLELKSNYPQCLSQNDIRKFLNGALSARDLGKIKRRLEAHCDIRFFYKTKKGARPTGLWQATNGDLIYKNKNAKNFKHDHEGLENLKKIFESF